MSEPTPLENLEPTPKTDVDVHSLIPKEGKIKIDPNRPAINAVYFADKNETILASMTYRPFWGSPTDVEVEIFTDESFRKQGLQRRLTERLIPLLRAKGITTM